MRAQVWGVPAYLWGTHSDTLSVLAHNLLQGRERVQSALRSLDAPLAFSRSYFR